VEDGCVLWSVWGCIRRSVLRGMGHREMTVGVLVIRNWKALRMGGLCHERASEMECKI